MSRMVTAKELQNAIDTLRAFAQEQPHQHDAVAGIDTLTAEAEEYEASDWTKDAFRAGWVSSAILNAIAEYTRDLREQADNERTRR
ncbi:hypothetical protein [Nocardioides sp.]|uniref:hypothetical protein n=1 Tax=Nocardioides sp. TaxID=35761 RepID=UPI0039E3D205